MTIAPLPGSVRKEDCLYLNIVRPTEPSSDPEGYPVMVFIHGGCFLVGSAEDSNYKVVADRLVSKGVIFISIQYRLGQFGFFTTGDEICPGNYGIWDQIQSLRFIQEVINDFGGNPNNVTPFGESAGGASISILGLSKEGERVFSKSILMSGTAHCPFALHTNVLETSNKIAETLKCLGSSQEKKIALKAVEDIVTPLKSLVSEIIPSDSIVCTYLNPIIDGDLLENFDQFKEIYQKRSKKPTLIGLCSFEERTFCLKSHLYCPSAKVFPVDPEDAAVFDEFQLRTRTKALLSQWNPYGDQQDVALNRIADFYIDQRLNYKDNQYFQAYTQLITDILFNIPAMREAVEKAETGSDVFFYIYDYDKLPNLFCEGAGHGSDLVPLFGKSSFFPDIPLEGDFKIVVSTFTDILVSFARDGVPSFDGQTLPKVENGKIPFIQINGNPSIGENLWPERLEFWNNMVKEFNFDWSDASRKSLKIIKK